ncbi:MAG: protein kinase [archaeon]|nr:protein kinase [archaeon]
MQREESSSNSDSDKDSGIVQIDRTYTINVDKELGKGGFGSLYIGENILTKDKVAVKVEKATSRSHLQVEAKIMNDLQGGKGIPNIYKFLKKKEENYMVMELLGKSIDKLFSQCKKTFSVKTVMLIGLQMIERIEYVHSKGYIHRDIKPGNFLIGLGQNRSLIYIIDFGLAKAYINKETGEHIPYKEGKGLTVK